MIELLTRLLGRLPIGWLQLMHNKTRLMAAVGGVTFANILIFMQLGFMNALFETSVFSHRSFAADIVLVSSDFRSLREANPLPLVRMYQALSHENVKHATPIYLGTQTWTDDMTGDTTNFRVIGVDPTTAVFADLQLDEKLTLLQNSDTAFLDKRTREISDQFVERIENGSSLPVEIAGRQIEFVSTFSQGASFDVDGTLIVSDQTFFRMFPMRSSGVPSLILVQLKDKSQAELTTVQLNSLFPEPDVLALTKQAFIDAEQNYQATQSPIGFVFGFGVAIGVVVGLVIVYQVLSTDVQDHLSEYATFKAIGYPPRFFLSLIFEEAISLAALGFLPGLGICLFLYHFASSRTGLPIVMPWGRPILVFVLTTVMCTVSGAIATRRLNSADPAELF